MKDMSNEELLQNIGNMSALELIALTKKLETAWGLKAEPQVVKHAVKMEDVMTAVQTEFNVFIMSVPADKKISVIKVVRELLNMPLKESKELVEMAPKAIKEGVTLSEAEDMKNRLVAAGAVVELK